jgi:serine protease Do
MDTFSDIQNNENKPKSASYDKKTLAIVALVSIIAGSIGGAFGSASLFRFPGFAKFTGAPMPTVSQRISLSEDSAIIDVVKKASPAVVSIVISKDISQNQGLPNDFFFLFGYPQTNKPTEPNVQPVGAGSGFFVSDDGLILTNRHVVSDEQASYTVVTNDNNTYPAKIVSVDPSTDLALIKIDIKNAPTLPFAESDELEIGQRVIAIGNSLGEYQNTVTTGIVSGIGRSISASGQGGTEELEGVIQTDAAINPGNSGGPLLNIRAEVVGLNTAIDRQGQLVGFAIPSNDAKKAVDSFKKSGKISRPQLGVRHVIISESLAKERKLAKDYGALVISGQSGQPAVVPGSGADKAGIKQGDIILELNNSRIDTEHSLVSLLKNYNAGDTIKLKVYRDNQEIMVSVTLGERT